MTTLISIVYHSRRGHTESVARAVARGAAVDGVEVRLIPVSALADHWDTLDGSAAIVFGCPTFMGSASAEFKVFAEETFHTGRWRDQRWKDKLAAGFTTSASQSGDKLSTLQQLSVFAAQHMMLWIGSDDGPGNNHSKGSVGDINRLGSWIGVMAQANGDEGPELSPPPSDLATAENLGRRVAEAALRWTWVRQIPTVHRSNY
jgi:multimeric flavodoxin WrbA